MDDISDKRLVILDDSFDEELLKKKYPEAVITVSDKTSNMLMLIEGGKCDVALLDEKRAMRVTTINPHYVTLGSADLSPGISFFAVIPVHSFADESHLGIFDLGWWQDWGNRIERNLLDRKSLGLIVGGFYTTVIIFIFGAVFAVILACLLTYLYVNHRWLWLYRPLSWFVFTIHDVPSIVLMMFFYYVVFAPAHVDNGILVSIIALGVYSSGTLAKIFKLHIGQVGREQRESAKLLGFSSYQIYRYIILPQALKSMMPLVIAEMKVLLRATSYAGYIAQRDLVKAVDAIRAYTYDAFIPLLVISLLYLGLSWLIAKTFNMLYPKLFRHD
ncbi:MAG: ABC transporter permease subunit [Parabacteroides sp.]|nr:ABC transporter permease subunit [Parabacteroides sp.]